jgi:class 3 adenylate cyclase
MKCPRCQFETPSDADFCPECGAKLAVVCASCGTVNAPTHKFCKKCGQRLGADTGAGQLPKRFTSPESYTPKRLAEKILTSKAALEGERKQVTVLFADLKGSMELLADRDPEEARKILDPVLTLMMEAVHRYEGTVNQVMGDGIMALFGAPLAHEDHAVRACYAALRMQEAVKRYAERIRRSDGVAVHIRVGLNSGEVVVRTIGSDLHMDYTAVGQSTHLAARMEQLADPGAIVITPATLALAEGYVEVKSLGPVRVKGLADPVEVYEVTGAGPARTRLQVSARRGLTRFVGRDAELEQLRRAQQLAGTGHGQVVAVVGDPGLGKSRLFWEFIHAQRTQGWLIVESSSVAYGKVTAFLPLIELLRTYFQIETRDEARKIREKVTGKLFSLDPALEPSLPALLWLLEVPVDDPKWQWLDPPQRRQRTLDGIKRLLLRESQVQPLLLVFDDLHWIDTETQAFLDSVVESLPTARLLLLVNYRPEYQHAWGSKTYYRQLSIDPLAAESAEELLEALLGNDTGFRPLKRLLIERTEGNPFFLEEIVRALVETRVLMGERGAYRLGTALSDIQVPPTVQAILAARVDRLSVEDKRLLQSAAVIGKDVPFALLAAIADVPGEELRRGLAHLQAAELVYETSLFPDLEYTFKHALTHEVAYRSLLKERRRELHARTVEAIERLYGALLAEHVERLVDHAVRGEVWDKAAVYGARAGTRATDRSAHPQISKAFLETALEAIGHLPENEKTLKQGIEMRRMLGSSLYILGERDAYLRNIDEALALAERVSDEGELASVLATRTNALWSAGENSRALESGHQAVTLAEAVGHRIYLVHACLDLGLVCQTVGDHRRALTLFAKAWNCSEVTWNGSASGEDCTLR